MRWCFGLVVLTLLGGLGAPARAAVPDLVPPADPFCAALFGSCVPPRYVAVVSAFPAEIEPFVVGAEVRETIVIGDRTYYLGTLAGARVVLIRGGIGLVNAATTAQAIVDRFPLSAIVFSGVAGSGLLIGDVAVPAVWTDHTESFPVDGPMLAVARTLTSPPVPLEECTVLPRSTTGRVVCLGRAPRIVVGGEGESADPFGGDTFPCTPGAGPIFGCDEAITGHAPVAAGVMLDATDMETAAVARVARDARVPFIAFRAASDGNGDPLGDRGFLAQFFDYYRLAANNAAAVTIAFLDAWTKRDARARPTSSPRVGAACDWQHAPGRVCARERAPRAVTRQVARACGLMAAAAAGDPGSAAAETAASDARKSWRRAARLLKGTPLARARCQRELVRSLEARGAEPAGALRYGVPGAAPLASLP
jgi:nucleoside phosphorylase